MRQRAHSPATRALTPTEAASVTRYTEDHWPGRAVVRTYVEWNSYVIIDWGANTWPVSQVRLPLGYVAAQTTASGTPRGRPQALPATIRQALVDDGLPPGLDPTTLSVLEKRGSYSGRSVSYFRVFDPAEASARGLEPRVFGDLDPYAELIVGSGHVEHGGAVALTRSQTI